MTTDQTSLLTRSDLLRAQAAYAAELDRLLERVHSWSYATADSQGYHLEDLMAAIREAAHCVRAIDRLIRELE